MMVCEDLAGILFAEGLAGVAADLWYYGVPSFPAVLWYLSVPSNSTQLMISRCTFIYSSFMI